MFPIECLIIKCIFLSLRKADDLSSGIPFWNRKQEKNSKKKHEFFYGEKAPNNQQFTEFFPPVHCYFSAPSFHQILTSNYIAEMENASATASATAEVTYLCGGII
jgi:hypothetical protein